MTEVNTTILPGKAKKIEAFVSNIDVKPYRKYLVYLYSGSGVATFTALQAVNDPWLIIIGNETTEEYLWRYTIDVDGYYYGLGLWNNNGTWTPFIVKVDPATKSVLWMKGYDFGVSVMVGGIHYLDIGYLLLTIADG